MSWTKGQVLAMSMCGVLLTQWFDRSFVVGGKPVLFVSELFMYLHTLLLIITTKGKLSVPKRILVILLPIVAYFLLHFIYSAFFLNVGNAFLTSRRLVYYPFLALTIGYSTAAAAQTPEFVNKVLSYMLKACVVLGGLNVVARFNMFQEFGFISRATGVTLSAFLFAGLIQLVRTSVLPKKMMVITLVATMLVFFTSSRGVYLSMILTTCLLLWQHRRVAGAVKVFKMVMGGLLVLSIISVVAMNSPLVIKTLDKFSNDISKIADGDMGSHGSKFNTLGARFYLYEAAFNLGLESPVFGNGSGYKVDSWHLGGSYGVNRSKTPHNYYLDIWYRMGGIGLLLFSLFYNNVLNELKARQSNIYYMLIAALIYTCFDVLLSSTAAAIIPIFMLVGASLNAPLNTKQIR